MNLKEIEKNLFLVKNFGKSDQMRENDEEFLESDRAMLDKMRAIYEENWEQLTTIT